MSRSVIHLFEIRSLGETGSVKIHEPIRRRQRRVVPRKPRRTESKQPVNTAQWAHVLRRLTKVV